MAQRPLGMDPPPRRVPVWWHVVRQAPEACCPVKVNHIVSRLPNLHHKGTTGCIVALHKVLHTVSQDVHRLVMYYSLQGAGKKPQQIQSCMLDTSPRKHHGMLNLLQVSPATCLQALRTIPLVQWLAAAAACCKTTERAGHRQPRTWCLYPLLNSTRLQARSDRLVAMGMLYLT